MSFIRTRDGTQLVRDTFPGNTCRLLQDPVTAELTPSRSKVPLTYAEMLSWMYVASKPFKEDPSRQFSVCHVPRETDAGVNFQLGVRTIGVLGKHNASPLGNWNGTAKRACKAIVYLELLPGPFVEQFEVQRDSLYEMMQLVERSLVTHNVVPSSLTADARKLFIQERVFTKITPDNCSEQSVLTLADDPQGRARAEDVIDSWRVLSKPLLAERKDDGRLARIHHLQLSQGDLVDVQVKFEIASPRGADGLLLTKVHLAFDQVIRLCRAEDFAAKLNVHIAPPSAGLHVTSVHLLEIDEEDDMEH